MGNRHGKTAGHRCRTVHTAGDDGNEKLADDVALRESDLRRFFQNSVNLVLQQEFFFFQQFKLQRSAGLSVRLHAQNLLVQGAVLLKQAGEMAVGGLELRDLVAKFRKHKLSLIKLG